MKQRVSRVMWGAVIGALAVAAASPAAAGPAMRFDVEFRDLSKSERIERARIWVSERRIRIEQITEGMKRAPHVLIYRGDQDSFLSLDPRKKTYMAVSRDMIAAFGVESKGARREVETRLRSLPDDQRRMLERLVGMREDSEVLAKATIRIEETGETASVGTFSCRWRHILRNGAKLGEICLADWAAVGIGPKDLEVFRQLANFQRELMGAQDLTPLEIVPNQPLDLLVQFDGFPLYFRNLRSGKLESEIRVMDARRVDETAGLFDPPSDYRVKSVFSYFSELMGEADPDAPAAAPAK